MDNNLVEEEMAGDHMNLFYLVFRLIGVYSVTIKTFWVKKRQY